MGCVNSDSQYLLLIHSIHVCVPVSETLLVPACGPHWPWIFFPCTRIRLSSASTEEGDISAKVRWKQKTYIWKGPSLCSEFKAGIFSCPQRLKYRSIGVVKGWTDDSGHEEPALLLCIPEVLAHGKILFQLQFSGFFVRSCFPGDNKEKVPFCL